MRWFRGPGLEAAFESKRTMRKRTSLIFSILWAFLIVQVSLASANDPERKEVKANAAYGCGEASLSVATGSPGSLGLLRALAEPFSRAENCQILWVKKGSGEALEALKAGKVDMVMVHAPAAEEKSVEEGWATMRTLMGCNEFYIVGPGSDPAGIRGAGSAEDAYARIARSQARFFSRGDNSGTHKKEMALWKKAGIRPGGAWYVTTADFMEATLMRADKESGYFMTDSSTFIAMKSGLRNLRVLFRGDPLLVNRYHALVAAADTRPEARRALSTRFVQFVRSSGGQEIIREFGIKEYGAALYLDASCGGTGKE
jgi:tungstate transport system substrate-binding protein